MKNLIFILSSLMLSASLHAQAPAQNEPMPPPPGGAPTDQTIPPPPPTAQQEPVPEPQQVAEPFVPPSTPTTAPEGAITSEETISSLLQPFNYEADNRRDPFLPFREIKGLQGGNAGPLLPLQRYELDEMRLIGIIWDVRNPKAMFLDPNRNIHTIGKDDRIGRNNGYIAVIREGEVVVVEPTNENGEISYETRVLRIDR